MNTRQSHDDHSNEQVSPKRHRALYERAPSTTSSSSSFTQLDVAKLNNLGVDCFENGVIPDASKCFSDAMSIFAPSLPQSLLAVSNVEVLFRRRDSSLDDTSDAAVQKDDHDSTKLPLTPIVNDAVSSACSGATCKSSLTSVSSITPRKNAEYDEGMNRYNRPIRIDESTNNGSTNSICYNDNVSHNYQRTGPVLLFNIGQLHVLAGNDNLAADYFMYALDIVKQSSSGCCNKQQTSSSSCKPIMDAIPILHNLGHIYYRAQNYNLSMTMYSKALDIVQRSYHDTMNLQALASTLNCMGVLFFHMSSNSDDMDKNATKALDMFHTSLSVRQSIIKSTSTTRPIDTEEESLQLATTMNNVGRVHYMLGNHTAALQTYVKAYGLRKELLSPNHLDLAASAYNLGQTHHQLGSLDEALKLYTEFYEGVSSYLGPTHKDVAVVLKCMAQVHHDKSQYEDAARLYYQSLSTTKAALGEFHPEVASTLNKIGNMYYENSDFDKAIKVYEEGLAVERAVLQSDHQNIVVTLTNIAQSYKHCGNHAVALERYTEAYNLQSKVLGPTHIKVAVTLSNIAQVSCRLGLYTKAFDTYQVVLQIRREAHGDNHVDVAATLNSIGLVLFRQGYNNLAIESFTESLRVRKAFLGDQHRDVAVVLYNLGTTYLEQGDEEKAMSYYAETLRVERSALGNDHRDLVVTLSHIGQVFQQRGELSVALEYFHEVLRIERLHHGNNSPRVARLLNKMGNIYLQKADVKNMMECFIEATRTFEASQQECSSSESVGCATDTDQNTAAVENAFRELKITGYNFYSLSILHPEGAAAA